MNTFALAPPSSARNLEIAPLARLSKKNRNYEQRLSADIGRWGQRILGAGDHIYYCGAMSTRRPSALLHAAHNAGWQWARLRLLCRPYKLLRVDTTVLCTAVYTCLDYRVEVWPAVRLSGGRSMCVGKRTPRLEEKTPSMWVASFRGEFVNL